MSRHPTHHGERAGADDLHVNVALGHVVGVPLVLVHEGFVAEGIGSLATHGVAAFAGTAAERAGSDVTRAEAAHDPVASGSRRGNVAVDVEDLGAFEHASSFYLADRTTCEVNRLYPRRLRWALRLLFRGMRRTGYLNAATNLLQIGHTTFYKTFRLGLNRV